VRVRTRTRLRADGDRLLRITPDGVRVYDLDGALCHGWRCPDGPLRVTDTLLVEGALVVALADQRRSKGMVARVEAGTG
jgi:hypothetical protein